MRRVPNPQLSLQRVQHLGVVLQRPTKVIKWPTLLQVEEEIRTLLREKLKAPIKFP